MSTKIEATRYDRHLRDAARHLVEQMSSIEGEHVGRLIGAEIYGEGSGPVPMWGTMFRVVDPVDRRKIADLLKPIIPGEDEQEDLVSLIEEYGLEIDLTDHGDPCGECEECEANIQCRDLDIDGESLHDAIIEAMQEGCFEAEGFHSAGYQKFHGIYGIEIKGDLYLGIDGAGYDFYESHWIPLYKTLGYSWHLQGLKQDLIGEVARTVAYAETDEDRARLATDLRVLYEMDASTLERQEGGE